MSGTAAEPRTLVDLLARASGDPTAGIRFVDRREEAVFHSWADLGAGAERVARGLVALGVERGERVALVFPTEPGFFHGFFGALLAGAVPVPLYPPVRLGRLEEYHRRTATMIAATSARLVLTSERVHRFLGETIEMASPALGGRTLGDVTRAGSEAPLPPPRADPEALALVQLSSGTTVDPKPVALTHRALLAQVAALNGFWPREVAPGVRPTGVSWLPLYHDMGLVGCVFTALEFPSVLTLLPPEAFVGRPALWLRAISRYRATISVAPSFAYALSVDRIRDEELEGVDLSPWRVALDGAEPVAPGVLRAFQRRFARWGFREEALTPVYGLSEAALAVTFSPLEKPFVAERFDRQALGAGDARASEDGLEIVSVGRALPGFEVRVGDAPETPAGDGRIGRVWVAGPSLMTGYLDRPEATAAALRGRWLDTGDLGFLHGGDLFLTGRAKDVLILNGRNHSPLDVEEVAATVPGCRAGCAVAVSYLPEGGTGERLLVFVEHRRGASREDRREMPARVREAVLGATALRPDEVRVLAPGTLPRTSSGKLRRGEALRLHLAGELAPPKAVTPVLLATALARSTLAYGRHRRALRRARSDGG